MKKAITILICILCSFVCIAQGTGTFIWVNGAPTSNPGINGAKFAVNQNTYQWYEWTGSAWTLSGDRAQTISGCAAPLYVPAKNQSRLVVNGCNPVQIFYFRGPLITDWDEKGITYTAGTGISIASGVITNTGDLSNTNELQTLSQGSTTVTLSNGGGTVNVDPSITNEIQTLSISGQNLSISGGNAVTLPTSGGGITWPLLAPDGSASAPSYSFENSTETGISLDGGNLTIKSADGITGIVVRSGKATTADGGNLTLNAGDSDPANGGNFIAKAGDSKAAKGGDYLMTAGLGAGGGGGAFTASAGNDPMSQGGGFTLASGSGLFGGNFTMTAGGTTEPDEAGGSFIMQAGEGDNGGIFLAYGGNGFVTGGDCNMSGGNGDTSGGSVLISGGIGSIFPGQVKVSGGSMTDGSKRANIVFQDNGPGLVIFKPMTTAQRDSLTAIAGAVIFNSTLSKLQVYTGSSWVDLH